MGVIIRLERVVSRDCECGGTCSELRPSWSGVTGFTPLEIRRPPRFEGRFIHHDDNRPLRMGRTIHFICLSLPRFCNLASTASLTPFLSGGAIIAGAGAGTGAGAGATRSYPNLPSTFRLFSLYISWQERTGKFGYPLRLEPHYMAWDRKDTFGAGDMFARVAGHRVAGTAVAKLNGTGIYIRGIGLGYL